MTKFKKSIFIYLFTVLLLQSGCTTTQKFINSAKKDERNLKFKSALKKLEEGEAKNPQNTKIRDEIKALRNRTIIYFKKKYEHSGGKSIEERKGYLKNLLFFEPDNALAISQLKALEENENKMRIEIEKIRSSDVFNHRDYKDKKQKIKVFEINLKETEVLEINEELHKKYVNFLRAKLSEYEKSENFQEGLKVYKNLKALGESHSDIIEIGQKFNEIKKYRDFILKFENGIPFEPEIHLEKVILFGNSRISRTNAKNFIKAQKDKLKRFFIKHLDDEVPLFLKYKIREKIFKIYEITQDKDWEELSNTFTEKILIKIQAHNRKISQSKKFPYLKRFFSNLETKPFTIFPDPPTLLAEENDRLILNLFGKGFEGSREKFNNTAKEQLFNNLIIFYDSNQNESSFKIFELNLHFEKPSDKSKNKFSTLNSKYKAGSIQKFNPHYNKALLQYNQAFANYQNHLANPPTNTSESLLDSFLQGWTEGTINSNLKEAQNILGATPQYIEEDNIIEYTFERYEEESIIEQIVHYDFSLVNYNKILCDGSLKKSESEKFKAYLGVQSTDVNNYYATSETPNFPY